MKPLMLKIILFALTKVLQHSATKHVAVRDRMMQHNCAVQIRLKDNSIGRYYIFQNGRVHSELVSFYQSGFQIHSMLCQMALHHLLCSRLVTHPDKNSQALRSMRMETGSHADRRRWLPSARLPVSGRWCRWSDKPTNSLRTPAEAYASDIPADVSLPGSG